MRKLIHLIAAAGLVLSFASTSKAGTFVPHESTLDLILGGLPSVEVLALSGTESLVLMGNAVSGSGHFVAAQSTVWSTVNFGPGTSLFTGVPLISNLKVTVKNGAGVLQSGHIISRNVWADGISGPLGPFFGGVLRMNGVTIIEALGGSIQLPVPLNHVGGVTGETTMVTLIGNNITATNGPFVTGAILISNITSNIVTLPGRHNVQGVAFTLQPTTMSTAMTLSTNGGYVSISGGAPLENTKVTVSGTNNLLSGSKQGMVTVVSPIRIDTGAIAGRIPSVVKLKFTFVPEPGTMLLLVSGAIGLAVIGRRRLRK